MTEAFSTNPQSNQKIFSALCRLITEGMDVLDASGLSPQEWQVLANLAILEGVAPLAYSSLLGRQGLDLPKTALHTLRQDYYQTAAQTELYLRELEKILD
jgi:hypothetical protein